MQVQAYDRTTWQMGYMGIMLEALVQQLCQQRTPQFSEDYVRLQLEDVRQVLVTAVQRLTRVVQNMLDAKHKQIRDRYQVQLDKFTTCIAFGRALSPQGRSIRSQGSYIRSSDGKNGNF